MPKNCMEPQNTLNSQTILRKKDKTGNIMLPDFLYKHPLHSYSNQNSVVLA